MPIVAYTVDTDKPAQKRNTVGFTVDTEKPAATPTPNPVAYSNGEIPQIGDLVITSLPSVESLGILTAIDAEKLMAHTAEIASRVDGQWRAGNGSTNGTLPLGNTLKMRTPAEFVDGPLGWRARGRYNR